MYICISDFNIIKRNQIAAVGYQGKILTSTDGNTWIYRNSGTYNNLTAITWTGTQFVAVGSQGI
jgi:hypothetical protein